MKKVILFDIDYTLFDALKFRKDLFKKSKAIINNKNIEIDEKDLKDVYNKLREEVKYFGPRLFARRLKSKLNLDIDQDFLEKEILESEIFLSNLYKEAKTVLRKLSADKDLIIGILSGGEDKFQRIKIKDLINFFHKDHVHILFYKEDNLKKIINKYKKYKLFLVDDIPGVLHKAKNIDKNIITIWIKRGRFALKEKSIMEFRPDHEIKNLNKIIPILKAN